MKMFFITIFIVMLFIDNASGQQPDPCVTNSILHRSSERGTLCTAKNGKELCDRRISDGWYRVFDDDTGLHEEIATKCQNKLFTCSTQYPIWMNGSHPSVADGIVVREACVPGLVGCCDSVINNIQVKNCNSFYVYFLKFTPSCDQGYCFGENKPCPPPDPCDADNHQVMDLSEERYPSCSVMSNPRCDSQLKQGWYRIGDGSSASGMPQHCVANNKCGTQNPLWLNGALPLVAERTVNRTVCVNTGNSCCNKSYEIQIKNCSSYVVYNLATPSECPESYCFDPCRTQNHNVLNVDSARSPECNDIYDQKCDSNLVKGWYRISDGRSNLNMPQNCVKSNYCSTTNPIWLKGTVPQVSELIVNRTVCVSTGRSCCDKTYDIQIKNCTNYAVYHLVPTNECPENYCFGDTTVCLSSANSRYIPKVQQVVTFIGILSLLQVIV